MVEGRGLIDVDAWARQPNEPGHWYDRLERFRLLGPGRSIEAVYRQEKETGRPSKHWYAAAKTWRWGERAEAWDGAERELIREAEADRRFDARQKRLTEEETLRAGMFAALSKIEWGKLDQVQALGLLPQLRIFYSDMIKAERLEYGEATEVVQDADGLDVAADVVKLAKKVYG